MYSLYSYPEMLPNYVFFPLPLLCSLSLSQVNTHLLFKLQLCKFILLFLFSRVDLKIEFLNFLNSTEVLRWFSGL